METTLTIILSLVFLFTIIAERKFVIAVNTQNRTADEVLSMPGWNKPMPAKMYSGYLDNGADGFLHYLWQFPTDVDPATAPVLVWSNGGPKCSSAFDGNPYEIGMFQFFFRNVTSPQPAPNDAPFDVNPFAWNKIAHVVFLTHPVGTAPAFGKTAKSLQTNDRTDGERNFAALTNLFKYKFPEYKNNNFFAAGESYAGVYLLMLSEQILNYLDAGGKEYFQNFKGIMVGNGVTDDASDDNFAYSTGLFLHGHGAITGNTFTDIVADCKDTPYSNACQSYWDVIPASLNIYGFTQWCYNPKDTFKQETEKRNSGQQMMSSDHKHFDGMKSRNRFSNKKKKTMRPLSERPSQVEFNEDNMKKINDEFASKYTPEQQAYMDKNFGGFTPLFGTNFYDLDCTDEYYVNQYFSRKDVQMAFNLPLNFNATICWNGPYTKTVSDVVYIYERLQKKTDFTIVIYNGIQDLIVPYTGTWSWMERKNWKQLTPYTNWEYVDKLRPEYGAQTGGWVMKIGANNTYFVSVRKGGHMVPEIDNDPAAAYEMYQRVLNGNLWNLTPFDAPKTFKSQFIDPNPAAPETSLSEKGKWIGVGFAICIGIMVVVLVAVVLVSRSRTPRQRHAEMGAEAEYNSGYAKA